MPDDDDLTVRLERLNETMDAGELRFLKRPGDPVRRDEPVLEVDLDKVTIELLAPADGVLLTTRGDGDARVGDELYTLRPGPGSSPPPRPAPKPAPPPASPAVKIPAAILMQLAWNAEPLLARARALRRDDTAPELVEAALLWTAIVRAAAAVPSLFERLVEARRGGIPLRHHDLHPDETRWLHARIGPGDGPAQMLAAARPGPGDDPPRLQVLRIHGAAPLAMLAPHGFTVVVGPLLPQPVVEAGAVVVRTTGTITLAATPWLPADVAGRLAAVLHEQLTAP